MKLSQQKRQMKRKFYRETETGREREALLIVTAKALKKRRAKTKGAAAK